MQVNIGDLNKRIQFIQTIKTKDDDGFDVEETKVIRLCWASFNKVSGTEMIKSNADFSDEKYRFLVRYTKTELSRKMQIKYNNKLYDIVYLNDYNDYHEFIELICTRKSIGD